ncbi:hypothetical protein J4221_03865 [Candidatus Pacearchaeota archaeon]|nr:hypothetical protein [Candidatus Pacearchaeota archaeon]
MEDEINIELEEKNLDKKNLKNKVEKFRKRCAKYVIAASLTLVSIYASLYAIENYPSKLKIVRDYDNIQLYIQKLNDEYNSLTQIANPPYKNEQSKSLEKVVDEYRVELSESISDIQQQSNKILNNLEYKSYQRDKIGFINQMRNYIIYPSTLVGLFLSAMGIKNLIKMKKARNELQEKFPHDWYM